MTPTRWHRVEEIFHAALAIPPPRRDEFIDSSCAGDLAMAGMVREMIEADQQSASLGELDAAVQHAAKIAIHGVKSEIPKRLGPYEIQREIGSGGMGTVYLATRADDQYRKQAAVKLIHRGMTFPGGIERFLQERQILANLDHPYIARMIDGGAAPDGRPYLILDYVEGQTIDAHCASHKLNVADRCRLFLKVCDAVAYAHQNLIVHRDMKPANILVTAEGTPKLLDFGIAKLLGASPGEQMTRTALGMMTPEYASPEQVRGLPVTTAVDVYALGAILFELLAGRPAHSFTSYSATELVRVICEQEVESVSRVASERIPTDLDKIVHKAMAKDPRDRYQSAEQLAEDIRRHLDRLPVLARGNSATYRARKFLQRNWVPVAAVVATIVSLLGGVMVARNQAIEAQRMRLIAETERRNAEQSMRTATEQRGVAQQNAREANAQRERADQRYQQARTLIHRFLFDIDKAIQDLPGTSEARRVVAKTALEYLDGMTRDSLSDRNILHELAVAYERVGDLQGSPVRPSLNDFAGALTSYRKALRIRENLGLDSPGARAGLMDLHASIGMALRNLNKRPESGESFAAGLRLWTPTAPDRHLRIAAANLFNQRAELNSVMTRSKESIADYRQAEHILSSLAGPGNAETSRSLALVRMHLGEELCRAGNYPEGLPFLRQSLAAAREIVALDPNNMAHQRALGLTLRALSSALLDRTAGEHRNTREALDLATQQVEVSKRIAEKDKGNHTLRRDYLRAIASLARVHSARDEWEPASRIFSEALALTETYAAEHPSDSPAEQDIAYYCAEIATAEFYLKRYQRALEAANRSVAIWENMIAQGTKNRFLRFNLALMIRRIGDIALLSGNREQARRDYGRAMNTFLELQKNDPATQMFAYQVKLTQEAIDKMNSGN